MFLCAGRTAVDDLVMSVCKKRLPLHQHGATQVWSSAWHKQNPLPIQNKISVMSGLRRYWKNRSRFSEIIILIIELIFLEHLLNIRPCFKHFMCINIFNLLNNSVKWAFVLSRFYTGGNWNVKKLWQLHRLSSLVTEAAWISQRPGLWFCWNNF